MINLVQNPIPTEKIVNEWIVQDRKVHLLKQGKNIRFKVIEMSTGQMVEYPSIPLGQTAKDVVSHLLGCNVVFDAAQIPNLMKPSHQWTFGDKEVSLLLPPWNDLIFNVFDKTTRRSIQHRALESLFPSHHCDRKTINRINRIRTRSMTEIIDFLKNFTLSCIVDPSLSIDSFDQEYCQKENLLLNFQQKNFKEHYKLTKIGLIASGAALLPFCFIPAMAIAGGALLKNVSGFYEAKRNGDNFDINDQLQLQRNAARIQALQLTPSPFLIEIEPISGRSQIDDRVWVSQFRWAVTLICYHGSEGNHASIIVEGLNNGNFDGLKQIPLGEYFMYKSHFYATNKIESEVFNDPLEFDQRTQIWKTSSARVVRMLQNIKKQMKRIQDKKETITLARFNPDEKNTHSCFTWAKGHLRDVKIVDLGKKTLWDSGFLPARAKNYTQYGNTTCIVSFILKSKFIVVYPQIALNNMLDPLDHSESSIQYRESI